MKRLLLTLLLQAAICLAWAYDFEVPMQGYTLYFNTIDEEHNIVELTAPQESGSYRWQGHTPPNGVLDIPAEVEYYGVRYTVGAVGERAFSGCAKITGLNLPTTISEIGAYAFSNCSGIRGVLTIGENVTRIGRMAFYGCTGITEVVYNAVACEEMGESRNGAVFSSCSSIKRITLGPLVQRIPDYAFVSIGKANSEWNMPANLEYIGEYAFAFCYAMKGALRLPPTLKVIGPYAFAQCQGITEIEIPARIERIDQRAFYQCVNAKSITARAIVPIELGTEAFGSLAHTTTLTVPCISTERYAANREWNRIRTIKAMEPCTVDITGRANDAAAGCVIGGGTFTPGDTATLTAVCSTGYGFFGWSDGNTDNPRTVAVTDTASYVAIMRKSEVVHEVEYLHDTIYKDGIEVIYEYFEVNDAAEPIGSQEQVVYNADKRRLEVPADNNDIVSVALYNDDGRCVLTGKPRRGQINMRRYPTGYYVVRIIAVDDEQILRFFHKKNK